MKKVLNGVEFVELKSAKISLASVRRILDGFDVLTVDIDIDSLITEGAMQHILLNTHPINNVTHVVYYQHILTRRAAKVKFFIVARQQVIKSSRSNVEKIKQLLGVKKRH